MDFFCHLLCKALVSDRMKVRRNARSLEPAGGDRCCEAATSAGQRSSAIRRNYFGGAGVCSAGTSLIPGRMVMEVLNFL